MKKQIITIYSVPCINIEELTLHPVPNSAYHSYDLNIQNLEDINTHPEGPTHVNDSSSIQPAPVSPQQPNLGIGHPPFLFAPPAPLVQHLSSNQGFQVPAASAPQQVIELPALNWVPHPPEIEITPVLCSIPNYVQRVF